MVNMTTILKVRHTCCHRREESRDAGREYGQRSCCAGRSRLECGQEMDSRPGLAGG